jgi:two-component system CheB/CheR fusion protein
MTDPAEPQKPIAPPIVAIGASAGGLEATSRLLDGLPAHSGIAFIVVQHLDPSHKSLMAQLLGEHTAMPVAEACEGCELLRDTVTIIPPGRYLTLRNGVLRLGARQASHGARLPFDVLLASLAENCGPRTVALVLSGTGQDGSHGLIALKAAGGYVIAQRPDEADYAGMPDSAVATGRVDQVLGIDAMPDALMQITRQMAAEYDAHDALLALPAPRPSSVSISDIVSYLGVNTAHDFRGYKAGTISRRIERRMAGLALPLGDYAAYLALLREKAAEHDLLARDLLINVTSFFRDPAVFEMLGKDILPELIAHLPAGRPLRIWVAGCSSGEEAYTLAMLASTALEQANSAARLQIFASDVDPEAIAFARDGIYSAAMVANIPKDMLDRHFVRSEGEYRVSVALRALVVFSMHNVLVDPPFSRMDMVSCRNLLIYLDAQAQARVTSLFHFALREGGILLLGSSETIGKAGGRFDLVAKGQRIYRHAIPARPGAVGFPFSFSESLPRLMFPEKGAAKTRQTSLADLCARALLEEFAPAAVLVNRARQCLYSTGPVERYLRIVPGYASLDLLAMAPLALRSTLREALDHANLDTPHVHSSRKRLRSADGTVLFRFEVHYLVGGGEDLWLVAFVDEAETQPTPVTADDHQAEHAANRALDSGRIAELERDLAAAQADLHNALAAQEATHQEQKAINEEALSVNEEFQSTNEELLTSKEELQSLNEELTALNSQLQETLDRQRLTSDDLQNVLYATNVGTLFLDKALRIRFFTPAILALFAVIPGDIGRPLADLRALVPDAELLEDAHRVVAEELSIEREVQSGAGDWFLRRIFPYRARDTRVEGVVITFADITERKAVASALEAAKQEAERANLAKSRFLAAASHDLRQPLQSLILLKTLFEQAAGNGIETLLARFGQTLGAMSSMLDTLLDINQIEAGAVEPQPVTFAISEVFGRLREEFADLAQTRNLALHIVPSSALVYSDPRLVEQMIRNLLGNAIKYTRHGRVVLGCRRRGADMLIEVWDTGIGIAPDQLQMIFEEFHQIGNAPPDSSRGLGLGLSIVQRLGDLLGHGVSVRSVPGKGSVFAICIPLHRRFAPDSQTCAPPVEPEPVISGKSWQVMVVEDDPDVLDLLTLLLTGQGYAVASAGEGRAAMRLLADGHYRPDVLLTDYNLPDGENGLDLLVRLRGKLGFMLPAIILSGDISTVTLARIAQAECLPLSKPVAPDKLVAAIEAMGRKGAVQPLPSEETCAQGLIAVIDDDPQILASIGAVIEAAGRKVALYPSAEAFLAAPAMGWLGCLLVDVHLPGISGIDLLRVLRAKGDAVPLILITGSGGIGLAVEAMRNGACDFIEKPVGAPALLASIERALAQGENRRHQGAAHSRAAALIAGLTQRQREVMRMVLAGHPSKNISADLGISQRTVENHRAAVMKRMGARSLPELARLVVVGDG